MDDNIDWLARAVKQGIETTSCTRDHCTPEEQAVVKAAERYVTLRQTERQLDETAPAEFSDEIFRELEEAVEAHRATRRPTHEELVRLLDSSANIKT